MNADQPDEIERLIASASKIHSQTMALNRRFTHTHTHTHTNLNELIESL